MIDGILHRVRRCLCSRTLSGQLPEEVESRNGYQRTSFRHWNVGLDPADGCCRVRCPGLIDPAGAPPSGLRRAPSPGW